MNRLKVVNLAVPNRIQQGRLAVDNGSERSAAQRFISKALDKWCYNNGVTLDFSRPGKLTDNPFKESFNGSFRAAAARMNV
jgi:putative transposase